ncbi:conserved hypothetical protein [Theileria orientalis strain Shintoku]|uniref:Uncharacterized protein n=1 Tax=Theileria orientalis strain Shintoku TaxID=869250 RepID=J4DNR2_THEOR|nr:conserved hypothetical protein [Theileria orientalis strain Shintoku]BAM39404.1 conserved hypothetical protein [Theileria orientalis strain Shintoku]|eukprot:XP_009689705.1 conserved hypothetical protein [Theileria orientalis strain Shintoku]
MYKLKLLYCVVLLSTIRAYCYSFDDYQANTAAILHLLSKEDSNKHLVNTVVDCMGKTFTSKGKSTDFLRCVNDLMHTDDLTNTDDIRYIIGNYAARASKLLVKCYIKKDDLTYCLRAFGDCLPLMLRGLFGYDVHKRNCRRLINLPKYDKEDDYYRDEEEEMLDESKEGREGESVGEGSRSPAENSEAEAASPVDTSEFSAATSAAASPAEKMTTQGEGDPETSQDKGSESDDSIEVISDQE